MNNEDEGPLPRVAWLLWKTVAGTTGHLKLHLRILITTSFCYQELKSVSFKDDLDFFLDDEVASELTEVSAGRLLVLKRTVRQCDWDFKR